MFARLALVHFVQRLTKVPLELLHTHLPTIVHALVVKVRYHTWTHTGTVVGLGWEVAGGRREGRNERKFVGWVGADDVQSTRCGNTGAFESTTQPWAAIS